MQTEKSITDDKKAKLTISLSAEEWDGMLDKAASALSNQVKVAGFRPGKVPREVLINQVGEAAVVSAAIEQAVQDFYPLAVKQENLKPIAFPAVSVEKATLTDPLVFSCEVAVLPEVKLSDYTKIKLAKKVEPIDESRIDEVINDLQKKSAIHEEVNRPAELTDRVEIDFEGFVDDQPFEGGASKNHPLVLGEQMFIPGFEEGVVGMSPGEEKEITVTFPDSYHAANLAGKPAKFKVKLHQVKAVKYPELTDEFAKKSANFDTLDALKADIRKFLEQESEGKAAQALSEEALLALAKEAQIDLPSELVDQELDSMMHDLKHQAENAKMTLEEYLERAGTDEAGLKQQWKEQAEQRVRVGLALEAFRTAENIEVSEGEIDAEIERLKGMYPADTSEIEERYKSSAQRERLKNMLASRRAVDRLVEIATQE